MKHVWSLLVYPIFRIGGLAPASIFSALALATHGKEAANALTAPFQNCRSVAEVFYKLWNFNAVEWFGWWGTAVMLLLAVAGLLSGLSTFAKHDDGASK